MTDNRRAVITGRGVLSPLGADEPSFAAAVRAGEAAAAAPFPGAQIDDSVLCHPISNPEALALSSAGRGAEPLSALATAAVRAALEEAKIPVGGEPLDNVGLVMNTVFGPSLALETYLARLREGGPRTVRPALFVDTLASMPASRVGIALGLRGSTAVMGGSSAFELALDWVRAGREQTVVAGGGEYLSPNTLRYYRARVDRSGEARPLLAQGAAFVVVEEAGRARERRVTPLAELLGAGAASEPQRVGLPWSLDPEGRAFACAMRAVLADADIRPGAVGTVVLASADDASERIELVALRAVFGEQAGALTLLRPKRLLGEALGASAGLSLLVALAGPTNETNTPAVVLVNAFEMGGSVTSLALRVTGHD